MDFLEAPSDRKRPFDEDVAQERAPTKGKRMKSKHQDPDLRAARVAIQQCCARNDLLTAMEAYEKAIEKAIKLDPQSFYNLLSLCDGLSDRSIHVGTPRPSSGSDHDDLAETPTREVDEESRLKYAKKIKEHMDQLKLPLTETAYTALVKLHARNNLFDKAESYLAEAESVQQCRPKLRMYSSLILAYCEIGRMHEALLVWLRLTKIGLVLSEKEYLAFVQCSTKFGYVRVMERVLLDLSEDVLVPSKETTRALTDWFQSPFATTGAETNDSDSTTKVLSEIDSPLSDPSTINAGYQVQSPTAWLVSSHSSIEPKTGVLSEGCLKDAVLKPVTVSQALWQEMMVMNETIVSAGKIEGDTSGVQGGRKGPKRHITDSDVRIKHWAAFQSYLDRECAKGKFDIIIDGANVGYHSQNFQSAPKHVDYRQIDWVVKHFQRENKKVLLVIHSRHFASNLMPREFIPLERSWRADGVLYCTPPGMNDDWFWLHAALFCGPATLVVTNDEMRDHHFQMLAPRSFLRWKDRHQIHFSFGKWRRDQSREVELQYPDIYSRRIQRVEDGLVIPRAKRGDERRFLDGTHVASDDEPAEETYECIRPKPE